MIIQTVKALGDSQGSAHRAFNGVWQADGINDYGEFPITPAQAYLFFPDKPFTISAWVRTRSLFPHLMFADMGMGAANRNSNTIQIAGSFGDWVCQGLYWGPSQTIDSISRIAAIPAYNHTDRPAHVVFTCDGNNNFNGIEIYVNKLKQAKSITSSGVFNVAASLFTSLGTPSFVRAVDGGVWRYPAADIADAMYCTGVVATSQEVAELFNYGTNNALNYSNYPARLMNARFMHFPLGLATDFQTISGDLYATDISGNNRHMRIFGQGTTPTIGNFY
jgi:hypothetical protein